MKPSDKYPLISDPDNVQRRATSKTTTLYYTYRGLGVFQLRVRPVGYLSKWMCGYIGASTWKDLQAKIDAKLDGGSNERI